MDERGWRANRKRVQRIWREEGLRMPAKAKGSAGLENRVLSCLPNPSIQTTSERSTVCHVGTRLGNATRRLRLFAESPT